MDTKGMIIGAVAAVVAIVLALLNEYRTRTRWPRIIRQPYINKDSLRKEIINSVLYCGDTHCSGQICMRSQVFFKLCNFLTEKGLLRKKKYSNREVEVEMESQSVIEIRTRREEREENNECKFQVNCKADHLENHMKTVRNIWATISIDRNNSGFGWSDNLKMITASPTTYDTYIN
ncbi:hypothetical protein RDABS01_028997, partial [Bienertia sinuspersici]